MSKDHALEQISSIQDLKEDHQEEEEEETKNSDSYYCHHHEEEHYCRTPTREEQKIPPIQSCPLAPKKQKKVVLRKRKLPELQFFEYTGRDEVESFLKSCSEFSRVSLGTATAKKRLTMDPSS